MRNRRIIACVVALAIAVLLNLPAPAVLRARGAVREGVAPFQNVLSALAARAAQMGRLASEAGVILDEKRRLRAEVSNLRYRLTRLRALEQENNRLRAELGFRRRSERRLVLCEVVARGDAGGWWQTVTLNRGSEEGLAADMAAITTEGLVGRVSAVSRNTAEVLLITDPNCRVACRFRRVEAFGIVRGAGVSMSGAMRLSMLFPAEPCRMEYIPKEVGVLPGDEVVTSGLGGIYPEGLLLGRVREVSLDRAGLYKRAALTPAADLAALKYVSVVLE